SPRLRPEPRGARRRQAAPPVRRLRRVLRARVRQPGCDGRGLRVRALPARGGGRRAGADRQDPLRDAARGAAGARGRRAAAGRRQAAHVPAARSPLVAGAARSGAGGAVSRGRRAGGAGPARAAARAPRRARGPAGCAVAGGRRALVRVGRGRARGARRRGRPARGLRARRRLARPGAAARDADPGRVSAGASRLGAHRLTADDGLCAAAPIIWSLQIVASKYSLTHGFTPLPFLALRFAMAASAFGLLGFWLERSFRIADRRDRLWLAAAAASMTGNQLAFAYSLRFTTAVTVAFMFGLMPIVAALLAAAVGIDRLARRTLAAGAVSFSGV